MAELITLGGTLLLQREDFPRTLKRLKGLAAESPQLFAHAAGVAAAKTLPDALAAAHFRPALDAYGDLVGLRYLPDKLPFDAEPDELVKALTANAIHVHLGFSSDEFARSFVKLPWWKALERRPSFTGSSDRGVNAEGGVIEVAPGARVSIPLRFEGYHATNDPLGIELIGSEYGQGSPGDARATPALTAATLVPAADGNSASLEVTVAERVRGEISIWLRSTEHDSLGSIQLVVRVPERDWEERLEVLEATHQLGERPVFLRSANLARALEQLRRFAARRHAEPGGEFLASTLQAKDLPSALAGAGLEPISSGSHLVGLRFIAQRLPGSRPHFEGFLDALSRHAQWQHRAQLKLRFAAQPDYWWFNSLQMTKPPQMYLKTG